MKLGTKRWEMVFICVFAKEVCFSSFMRIHILFGHKEWDIACKIIFSLAVR